MPIIIVCGLQYGDEGKGKIVDYLSQNAKFCCRVNGGPNAGHTVNVGNKQYKFKQLPSGAANRQCQLIIGPGCVVDAQKLMEEIGDDELNLTNRLHISTQSHLILKLHRALDEQLEDNRIYRLGTTGSGIGPCYAAKALRLGIQTKDLRDEEEFQCLYHQLLTNFGMKLLDEERSKAVHKVDGFVEYMLGKEITPYVKNIQSVLRNFIPNKDTMVIEVAQGSLLDIDHGDYPFVTSSTCNFSVACQGLGIPYKFVEEVLGVVKLFTTRVGEGFFPTEITDGSAYYILRNGEIGVNTNRQRRVGWLDIAAVRHALFVSSVTEIVVTKLDVLAQLDEIKIATKYYLKGDVEFKALSWLEAKDLGRDKIDVEYLKIPGWPNAYEQTRKARHYYELPEPAKFFLQTLQQMLPQQILFVGVGPERDAIISLVIPDEEYIPEEAPTVLDNDTN